MAEGEAWSERLICLRQIGPWGVYKRGSKGKAIKLLGGFFHFNHGTMFYAYVLRSLSTGNFYKGSTEDLEARLKAHNEGLSRYTRGRGPWELVYWEEFSTRSEAVRRERFFKSGTGRNWLKEKLGQSG